MQTYLHDIIQATSRCHGPDFFARMALQLDKAIASDYTFIARIDEVAYVSKTIALVVDGQLIENIEYSLEHTPCANVADDSLCFYPCDIQSLFPKDELLVEMGVEGYIGAPLYDSYHKVMGIVVALYRNPIKDEKLTIDLFQFFADRIAGEIERFEADNKLKSLNESLEQQVKQRTHELEQVIHRLQRAQSQLIEAEKLAAMGNMISGVAHEVNTPLGVAITAQSHLVESFSAFNEKLSGSGISKSDMNQFMATQQQCLPLIGNNLNRAKQIIENFKSLATDQVVTEDKKVIDISSYYAKTLETLTPLFKRKKVDLQFTPCDSQLVNTIPGCHAILLTNLVTNSIEHGFVDSNNNHISVAISKTDDDIYVVDYKDNGLGINVKDQKHIFEPFFTTTRSEGSTGLGLTLCYNLVSNNLNGKLTLEPSQKGVHFRYKFKSL